MSTTNRKTSSIIVTNRRFFFKCRQTTPDEYELECKIVNVDGDPCFPDLLKMIEANAPLTTVAFPLHSWEAFEAANKFNFFNNTIVTADNIEAISLQAPFEKIPAYAFAKLPRLKRITLESLDGVKTIFFDKEAFKNTTAKHLHFVGYDVRHVMAQKFNMYNIQTVTFSDVEIDCYHDRRDSESSLPFFVNVSCEHVFENMKTIETLNLESIYVKGDEMDARVFFSSSRYVEKIDRRRRFQTSIRLRKRRIHKR